MRTTNSLLSGLTGGLSPAVFIVLVIGVLTNVVSTADNSTGNGGDTKPKTAMEKGLEPVYVMTNYFMDLVQPDNPASSPIIGYIQKSGVETLINNLQSDWQTYTKYYIGYTACIAVGIIFIILMPIIGCCVCCCRCCCGNCGGGNREEDEMDGKHAKCGRWTFGTILLILTTVMLGGTVCAFLTNEILREKTSASTGVLNDISTTAKSLDTYLKGIENEVKPAILTNGYDPAKAKIFTSLDTLPNTTLDKFGNLTKAGPLLKQAEDLANRVNVIKVNLDKTKTSTTNLVTYGQTLKTKLTDLKNAVNTDLQGCSQQICIDLRTKVNNLQVNVDFSKVDDVTNQISNIQNVLQDDIVKRVQQGYASYQSIATDISNDVKTKINDAKTQANDIRSKIESNIDDSVIPAIRNLSLSDSIEGSLKEAKPVVEQYGDYRWYAGLGISCVLLLIILLNYMGIMFGACGKRPHDHAPSCNKGVGANLLLASVTFIFLFSWLLMLITMVLFIGGSTVYTELCRQIVKPTDPESFKIVDSVIQSDVTLKNATKQFTDALGPLSVYLATTMKNCKANQGLGDAADGEKLFKAAGYNLTKLLDANEYGLDNFIKQVKNTNFNIPTVDIITTDMKNSLMDLANTGVDSIDFVKFQDELKKKITSLDLDSVRNDLTAAANAVRSSDPTLANKLDTHATTVTSIQNNEYKQLQDEMPKLSAAINSLTADANIKTDTLNLITSLETAENNVNSQASTTIKAIVGNVTDSIMEVVSNALVTMKVELFKIGPCRPVYNAYMSGVNLGCHDLLQPLNAFWYSVGWNIFFFIPSIIFSLLLVSLYRKIEPFSDKPTFDDPRFDEYTGMYPGDNMPLEQMDNRKNYGRGQANAGYERDEYNNQAQNPNYKNYGGYPGGGYGGRQGYGGGGAGRGYNDGYPPPPASRPPQPPRYH